MLGVSVVSVETELKCKSKASSCWCNAMHVEHVVERVSVSVSVRVSK